MKLNTTLKNIILLLIIFISVETIIRVYLKAFYSDSFFYPSNIIYHYYPQAKLISNQYKKSETNRQKILVLSSSALTDEWGYFRETLQRKIDEKKLNYEVFNAAGVGHSSLDNLNVLGLLNKLHFDEIIFYNGINDARFNNCPKEIYKSNYGHIKWNNEINCINRHKEINITTIPFIVDYSFQKIKQLIHNHQFIPENYKDNIEWKGYGSNFKSLTNFEENVKSIIDKKNNSTFHFISFLYYIPPNYTYDKFINKELDYNYHANSREIEVWGKPSNVSAFIDSTNKILLKICSENKNSICYDFEKLSGDSIYFADVCHFSESGIDNFTDKIIEVLNSAQSLTIK
jgi:hypothetical protein